MKVIECPRDAMQGIPQLISTEDKIRYINQLTNVGFNTIDFGSFVSPKAVPQMADTADVLAQLGIADSTKLLAIIANQRGFDQAIQEERITYLGYPFSISETFQQRNTNAGIDQSLALVKKMQEQIAEKELVVYISMGFGNPYGDAWNPDVVEKNVDAIVNLGVKIISLADTVGIADGKTISSVYNQLAKSFPEIELGTHLHSTPSLWRDKVQAAYDSGCTRFDAAIAGYGGCPFADDELVGNIATENLVAFFSEKNIEMDFNKEEFANSLALASEIFPS